MTGPVKGRGNEQKEDYGPIAHNIRLLRTLEKVDIPGCLQASNSRDSGPCCCVMNFPVSAKLKVCGFVVRFARELQAGLGLELVGSVAGYGEVSVFGIVEAEVEGSAGERGDFGDRGEVDDGGAMNAEELFGVELFF